MHKKTTDEEIKPPKLGYLIRDMEGKHDVELVFNLNQKCFEYDVIRLKIGNREVFVSRDDLAACIVNGHEKTKTYVEDRQFS